MINIIGEEAQIGHTDHQLTIQDKTGVNEADKMKNIYDLEGNNFEWIAQANDSLKRVVRGGYYFSASNGNFGPASSRSAYSLSDAYTDFTSRKSLYVSL